MLVRPVQSSAIVQRPSPQTVVGSGRRPQAASRSDGDFRDPLGGVLANVVELIAKGLSRFVALLTSSSKGEVRPSGNGKAKGSAASRVAAERRSSRGRYESRMLVGAFARLKYCSCRS